MAEQGPAAERPKKLHPKPDSDKKSYQPRRPTPAETAKDEHVASLKDANAFHIEQYKLAHLECNSLRSLHALEVANLREAHAKDVHGLRDELGRLKPEVVRLRESLANLKSNAGLSAFLVTVGGVVVVADAGQFPSQWQAPSTVGGVVAQLSGLMYLLSAARHSKPIVE